MPGTLRNASTAWLVSTAAALLVMATSLLLSHPSEGLPAKKSPESLSLEHHTEGIQRTLRFAGSHLQYYQLEGDLITAWYELELAAPQADSLWKSIEADRLLKLQQNPGNKSKAPGAIQEQNDLSLTIESKGLRHEITWRQGAKPPLFVSALMERLQSLVTQEGNVPRGTHTVFLADDIDRPNGPANVSIAEALKRGGVAFKDLEKMAPAERSFIDQAIALPGWLVTSRKSDSRESNLAPIYVEAGGRHFRIRQLNTCFASEEGN